MRFSPSQIVILRWWLLVVLLFANGTVTLGYGTAGAVDDALSRIVQITSNPGSTAPVATFSYIGSGRRGGFTLGGNASNSAIAQDMGAVTSPTIGRTALDCFGRAQAIDYKGGTLSASTLLKLDYTFDQAGNRLSEIRTPQPGGASGTHRDQINTYDPFGRLTESDLDNVTSGGTHTNYFANQWSLDALGNWLELDTTLTTNSTTETREHNHLNEITDSQIGASPTIEPIYDEAGNLRFDGQFVYQYDAWNRLCQVNLPHATEDPGTPGLLVKHYLYDGLGRLIRVQSPYPDPETGQTNDEVRSERIFYDGVRRIQELVTDPLPDTSFAAQEGNQQAQQALAGQTSANHNTASAGTENSLLGGGPGGGTGLPPGLSLEREYIWGPGDRGLDELLAQYGPTRNVSYPLHDGGGDIIALVDKGGVGGATRLLWQATYDAYGQIIDQESPVAAHTFLHAGHKGLFFDRLDSSIVDPVSFNEIPRLMPAGHAGSTGTARIIGYARNRHLHTRFGRWLQRDPNETGVMTVSSPMFHGRYHRASPTPLDIDQHLSDGANVLEYLASSTLHQSDSLGLFIQGPLDTLLTGIDVGMTLYTMVAIYAENQLGMVEWALDWALPDDLLGVGATLGGPGFNAAVEEAVATHAMAEEFEPLMGGLTSVKAGYRALRAMITARGWRFGQVFDSYSAARLAKAGMMLGQRAQAHHLVPEAICRVLKISTDAPAVILGQMRHQILHRKVTPIILQAQRMEKAGISLLEIRNYVLKSLEHTYAGQPEWIEAVIKYLN